jgi:hypothetical protein
VPESVPWAGWVRTVNASGSLSGSEPVSTIDADVSSGVVMLAEFALGAWPSLTPIFPIRLRPSP